MIASSYNEQKQGIRQVMSNAVTAWVVRHQTSTVIGIMVLSAAIAMASPFLLDPYYGVVPEDLLHVNVVQVRPGDLAPQLQRSRVGKNELTAQFRTGSAGAFKWIELDWDDANSDGPSAVVFKSARGATIPPEVKARLNALLGGGLAADGSWTYDGIRIEASDRKLTLSVDPKTKRSLFTRRVAVGFRVLDSAAFGAPLLVDDDEMREIFGAH